MTNKTVSQLIETSKAQWKPSKIKGVDYVALHADPNEKIGTLLYRMGPNTLFPKHRHPTGEEILLLRGDLKVAERVLKAGDFLFSPPGSIHEFSTTAGCMFVSMVTRAIEIIPNFVEGDLEAQPNQPEVAATPTGYSVGHNEIDPTQISEETKPAPPDPES